MAKTTAHIATLRNYEIEADEWRARYESMRRLHRGATFAAIFFIITTMVMILILISTLLELSNTRTALATTEQQIHIIEEQLREDGQELSDAKFVNMACNDMYQLLFKGYLQCRKIN